jgi:hypothetical protein
MKQRLKWGRLMKKPENENLTLLSLSRRLSANSCRQWYYTVWGGGIRKRTRIQIKQQPELKKSHFTVSLEALCRWGENTQAVTRIIAYDSCMFTYYFWITLTLF